jgi:hypothetical protein
LFEGGGVCDRFWGVGVTWGTWGWAGGNEGNVGMRVDGTEGICGEGEGPA